MEIKDYEELLVVKNKEIQELQKDIQDKEIQEKQRFILGRKDTTASQEYYETERKDFISFLQTWGSMGTKVDKQELFMFMSMMDVWDSYKEQKYQYEKEIKRLKKRIAELEG